MYLRLNDVFPDWLTGDGIFYYLQSQDLIPWKDADIADILDTAYHGEHGDRLISPLVRKLLNTDNELTTANKQKLASVIYNLFIDQWSHEYNLLLQEYDPISNYDMEEVETPAETTNTITPAETTTTITPAETTVETLPPKLTTENEVSAFNSSGYVEDTKVTSSGDSGDKGSEQLTVNQSGSNSLDVDTAGSEVFTVQHDRRLTRKGNIGVTTTQQMMQSEIELWKWNFYRSVFKDIDSVLTLKIY
jgi:hypothetical protein